MGKDFLGWFSCTMGRTPVVGEVVVPIDAGIIGLEEIAPYVPEIVGTIGLGATTSYQLITHPDILIKIFRGGNTDSEGEGGSSSSVTGPTFRAGLVDTISPGSTIIEFPIAKGGDLSELVGRKSLPIFTPLTNIGARGLKAVVCGLGAVVVGGITLEAELESVKNRGFSFQSTPRPILWPYAGLGFFLTCALVLRKAG